MKRVNVEKNCLLHDIDNLTFDKHLTLQFTIGPTMESVEMISKHKLHEG